MLASANDQRPGRDPWNIGFGVVVLIAAILSLLVWFPNDIKGGFIELNQVGKPEPGDAFFPIILASMLVVLSCGQLVSVIFGPHSQHASGRLTFHNLKFLITLYAIIAAGLLVMFWLGPLVVNVLRAAGVVDNTYRQLADTVPYKYLGFVVGGFIISFGLIIRAEGMVRTRAALTVIVVIAVLIFILDILLHNIQLPPNADF